MRVYLYHCVECSHEWEDVSSLPDEAATCSWCSKPGRPISERPVPDIQALVEKAIEALEESEPEDQK